MKNLILIACLLLMGCATYSGYCVPESIMSAWTYEIRTGLPTRIAISNIEPGIDHAQAQGWTGKEWIWLTTDHGATKEWVNHFGKEPYRYLTLDEFIKEQSVIRNVGIH